MVYIIFRKRADSYGEARHELTRHEGDLPAALHAYAEALRENWDEVILAEELKPMAYIEVRLADSGAVVPLTSD